nr:stalk domain-containing protein [Sporosalibacterium faouarense]
MLCIIAILIFNVPSIGEAVRLSKVEIDGREIQYEVQPYIINGELVVPLVQTLEAMGFKVETKEDGKIILGTKNNIEVKLIESSRSTYINDEKLILNRAVYRRSDLLVVPVSFLSDGLGAKVLWDESERELIISSKNELSVHFIDVGNGDSIFIDYGDYDILIDVGNKESGKVVANYLESLDTDDIEILITTHPDENHVGGLEDALNDIGVETFIHSGTKNIREVREDYFPFVSGLKVTRFMEDDDLTFDLGNGVYFHIIETGGSDPNINNNSVITMLEHNSVKVLLTGDMEEKTELRNLDKFSDIDVLKVANHGLNTSTSGEFLDVTKPEVAIISSGLAYDIEDGGFVDSDELNSSKIDVINRLKDRDVEIYDTYDSGNIVITIDGENYEVENREISGVLIRQIDFDNKFIALYNGSQKVQDLSGCKVVDRNSKLEYYIEEKSLLSPGKQDILRLVNIKAEEEKDGEWIFREDFISDKGTLFDREGNVLCKFFKIRND